MVFGGQRFDVEHLVEYVETATSLGFDALSVNDHMVFAGQIRRFAKEVIPLLDA
jgi:hypothetical protein